MKITHGKKAIFTVAIIYSFFCTSLILAQSFIKTLDLSNLSVAFNEPNIYRVVEDPDGTIYLASTVNTGMAFIELNAEGLVQNSYKMVSDYGWLTLGASPSYQYVNHHHAVTFYGPGEGPSSGLFVFNFTTDTYWAKALSLAPLRIEQSLITSNGTILTTHDTEFIDTNTTPYHPKSGLSLMDLVNGNVLWSYMYDVDLPHPSTIGVYAFSMAQYSNGDFSLINGLWGASVQVDNTSLLLRINSEGEVIKSVSMPQSIATWKQHTIDNEGNVYIYGSMPNIDDPFMEDAFVLKLDDAYNIIWAKRLAADEFNYLDMRIAVDDEQNIYFCYATAGDFPVIAGQLNPDGDLLWHKGYAAYFPRIFVTQAHELLITSRRRYFSDGTSESGIVLMKTNPDGSFDNCSTFPVCLMVEDVFFELDTLHWTRRIAPDPTPLFVSVENLSVTSEDYCPEARLPKANFTLPSRICPSTTIQADSLENQYANQVEWQIRGVLLDTIIRETNFSVQLDEPGYYTITQTIWVLGCADTFSRQIEVIDESSVDFLVEDQLICEDEYLLESQILFSDSATFIWNNGANSRSLAIQTGGLYAVSVDENACIYTDTVALRFLKELTPKPVINTGADTTVCVENLPFILIPTSAYSDTFWLENQENQANTSLLLENEGLFYILSQVEGCFIGSDFELNTESCEATIYLPNVFSPNQDGVNDVFEPLGNNFTGVELSVFDRWGSLIYQAQQAPFKWNGRKNKQFSAQGIYVIVFKFVNKLTMQEEVLVQDVMLLR